MNGLSFDILEKDLSVFLLIESNMSYESKEEESTSTILIDSHRILEGDTNHFQVIDPFSNSQNFSQTLLDILMGNKTIPEDLESILYRLYSRLKHYDPMLLNSMILLGHSETIHIEFINPKLTPLSREVLKKVILRVSEETYREFRESSLQSQSQSIPAQLPSEPIKKIEQFQISESLRNMMIDVLGFSLDFQGGITFENSDWKSMIAGIPDYQEHRMELMTYFGRYMNFKGHIQLLSYPYIQLPGNRMTHDEPLRELYKTFLKTPIGKSISHKKTNINLLDSQSSGTQTLIIPVEKEGSIRMDDLLRLGFREFFTFIPGRTNFLNIQSYLRRTDIPDGKISVRFL
jgi:hypothetical protein